MLLLAACTTDPAATDNTAPEVTTDTQAELTVTAISAACGDLCNDQPLYVIDQLVDTYSLTLEGPMPAATTESISEAYPDVTWVDLADADPIFETADNGQGVLVTISPVLDLAPEIRGVEVAVHHGSSHGQIIQFQWNGSDWVRADSDDTGVTVTSFVS